MAIRQITARISEKPRQGPRPAPTLFEEHAMRTRTISPETLADELLEALEATEGIAERHVIDRKLDELGVTLLDREGALDAFVEHLDFYEMMGQMISPGDTDTRRRRYQRKDALTSWVRTWPEIVIVLPEIR